jgi:hypothetical protein
MGEIRCVAVEVSAGRAAAPKAAVQVIVEHPGSNVQQYEILLSCRTREYADRTKSPINMGKFPLSVANRYWHFGNSVGTEGGTGLSAPGSPG